MCNYIIKLVVIGILLNISCTSNNDNFKGGYKYNIQYSDSVKINIPDSVLNEINSLEEDFFNENQIKIGPVIRETIEY